MKKIKVLTSFYYNDYPYQAGQIYDLDDNIVSKLASQGRVKVISSLTDSEIENILDDFSGESTSSNMNNVALIKTGDYIYCIFKYKDKDMWIRFEKIGANNFVQIGNFYLVDNDSQYLLTDVNVTKKTFNQAVTDWVGPYMLRALENADGNGTSYQYTGGCHGFGGGQTGSATGRQLECEVFMDGRKIIGDGTYRGNQIMITCKNRIQAYNTKKEDGSGREVLEETIRYIVTNNHIRVENKIKALEKIRIEKYHSLQAFIRGYGTNATVSYITQSKSTPNLVSNGNSSGGKKGTDGLCNKVIVENETDELIVYIDEVGLGKRKYMGDDESTAHYSNEKVYLNVVFTAKPLEMLANDIVYLSGGYYFYRK